jgi:hypothetical protein
MSEIEFRIRFVGGNYPSIWNFLWRPKKYACKMCQIFFSMLTVIEITTIPAFEVITRKIHPVRICAPEILYPEICQ